jgi:hypothetical protein
MKLKTKNAIYSLLDLIDSLASISFLKLDLEQVNEFRSELVGLMNENTKSNYDNLIYSSNDSEILGVLSQLLLDRSKFSSATEIVEFAEKCLKMETKAYWNKRSRPEVTGIVLSQVIELSSNQRKDFLRKWYMLQDKNINFEKNHADNDTNNNEFINLWMKLYE